MSVIMHGFTAWTQKKCLEKKTRWEPHKKAAYNFQQIPDATRYKTISQTIQVRWTTHARHCWRSKDKPMSNIFLWTTTHGHTSIVQSDKPSIHLQYEDIGSCPEDLSSAIADRVETDDERVKEIYVVSSAWWWRIIHHPASKMVLSYGWFNSNCSMRIILAGECITFLYKLLLFTTEWIEIHNINLNYHNQKIQSKHCAQHREPLDSYFDLIRSHQQCIPWSPPLEIKPAITECRAETLPLSYRSTLHVSWTVLARFSGQGNSNLLYNYSILDKHQIKCLWLFLSHLHFLSSIGRFPFLFALHKETREYMQINKQKRSNAKKKILPMNVSEVAEWMEPLLRISMIFMIKSFGMVPAKGKTSSLITCTTWKQKRIFNLYIYIYYTWRSRG